jgi:hypothetical protein
MAGDNPSDGRHEFFLPTYDVKETSSSMVLHSSTFLFMLKQGQEQNLSVAEGEASMGRTPPMRQSQIVNGSERVYHVTE